MSITMRDMFKAGVHYGHQKRYWNPQMAPFIYGDHNKIHIINLEKTLPMYKDAQNFVGSIAAKGGKVLFVGTKRAAQKVAKEHAERAGMPYVNHRWLGGMLTNYKTVRQSIKRLRDLEKMKEDGGFERLTKKEGLKLEREMLKLERSLGGIKHMAGLPDAIVLIDSSVEKIAITEAKRLGIPVIGVVDTNGSPDDINYLIPGNDDAIRSIDLYFKGFADAIVDAREAARLNSAAKEVEVEESDALAEEPAKRPGKAAAKPADKKDEAVDEKPAKKEAKPAAKKADATKEAKPAAKKAEAKKEAKPAAKKAAAKKADKSEDA